MVDKDPRPLPLEEQIKQDPRFSYLASIDLGFTNLISGLMREQSGNPVDLYPKVWLLLLEKYNKTLGLIGSGMQEMNDKEGFTVHKNGISKFLTTEIEPSIIKTREGSRERLNEIVKMFDETTDDEYWDIFELMQTVVNIKLAMNIEVSEEDLV